MVTVTMVMTFHAVVNVASGAIDFVCNSNDQNGLVSGFHRRLTAIRIGGTVSVQFHSTRSRWRAGGPAMDRPRASWCSMSERSSPDASLSATNAVR